jgi:hypothetical protein
VTQVVTDLVTALEALYDDVIAFAVHAVEALVVALVAFFLARVLRRRMAAGLLRARVDPNVATLASNGILVSVYATAATLVVSLLGGNWTSAVTILSAGTVALTLALQDVLRGFVAGVYLLLERPFAIGDRIKVRDVEGEVQAIDLRTTVLRSEGVGVVVVPNATVFGEILTNRSVGHLHRTTARLSSLPADGGDPIPGIEDVVRGLPGLVGLPRLDEVTANDEGVAVAVSVAHAPESEIAPALAARLRERFPSAAVSVSRTPM